MLIRNPNRYWPLGPHNGPALPLLVLEFQPSTAHQKGHDLGSLLSLDPQRSSKDLLKIRQPALAQEPWKTLRCFAQKDPSTLFGPKV